MQAPLETAASRPMKGLQKFFHKVPPIEEPRFPSDNDDDSVSSVNKSPKVVLSPMCLTIALMEAAMSSLVDINQSLLAEEVNDYINFSESWD